MPNCVVSFVDRLFIFFLLSCVRIPFFFFFLIWSNIVKICVKYILTYVCVCVWIHLKNQKPLTSRWRERLLLRYKHLKYFFVGFQSFNIEKIHSFQLMLVKCIGSFWVRFDTLSIPSSSTHLCTNHFHWHF